MPSLSLAGESMSLISRWPPAADAAWASLIRTGGGIVVSAANNRELQEFLFPAL